MRLNRRQKQDLRAGLVLLLLIGLGWLLQLALAKVFSLNPGDAKGIGFLFNVAILVTYGVHWRRQEKAKQLKKQLAREERRATSSVAN